MSKLLAVLLGIIFPLAAFAQIPISSLPNANLPLTGAEQTIINQTGSTKKTPVSSFGVLFPPLNATYILVTPNAGAPLSRVLVGTANEILLSDGGALGNLVLSTPQPIATTSTPTFAGMTLTGAFNGTTGVFSGTLSSAGYTGTTGSFSGALSAGSLSLTTPLPATSGGTGFGSYAIGDLLSASTTTALSKISDVAAGAYLRSGGVATLPLWSTLTLPNAATTGDLFTASAANTMGVLADVTVGSYLRSGGASTAPLYSTVKIPNTAVTGDIWAASAANTVTAVTGNITTSTQWLSQTGSGAVSASPVWAALPGGFTGFANPSGLITLTAANGVATTATRSDATHAIDQSIVPTWTGIHTFSATPNLNAGFTGTFNLNTTKQNALSNTSTGTSATTSIGVNNGTDTFQMGINGLNNVSPFFTGGPATTQAYLGTISTEPLSIATGGTERIRIDGTTGVSNFVPGLTTSGSRPTPTLTNALVSIGASTGGISQIFMTNGAATADNHAWDINAGPTDLNFRLVNDANTAATTWLDVSRLGILVTGVTFPNGPILSQRGVTAGTASGTPVTIFTMPASTLNTTWFVTCYLATANDLNNYGAVYLVQGSNTVSKVTSIQTATLMTISSSGLNVQCTQGSGSPNSISYAVLRWGNN